MSMRTLVVPAITSAHPPEPFMEPSTVPRHLLLLPFKALLLVLLLPGNDIAIIFVMGRSLMNLSIFIHCTSAKSSAVATQQWNSYELIVGKCTSRGITITSSGNALEHFIPNNPPLNLILHLQSSFLLNAHLERMLQITLHLGLFAIL
nr:hypothetical protein [Tanacetum cinerariifolium]